MKTRVQIRILAGPYCEFELLKSILLSQNINKRHYEKEHLILIHSWCSILSCNRCKNKYLTQQLHCNFEDKHENKNHLLNRVISDFSGEAEETLTQPSPSKPAGGGLNLVDDLLGLSLSTDSPVVTPTKSANTDLLGGGLDDLVSASGALDILPLYRNGNCGRCTGMA